MESHWGLTEGRQAVRKVTWKVGTQDFRWGQKITWCGLRPVVQWDSVFWFTLSPEEVESDGRAERHSIINNSPNRDWLEEILTTIGFGFTDSRQSSHRKCLCWAGQLPLLKSLICSNLVTKWLTRQKKRGGIKTLPPYLLSASFCEHSYLPIAFHPDNSESTLRLHSQAS